MLLEEKRFYIFQCSRDIVTGVVLPVLPFGGVSLSSTLHNMVYLKNVFNFSLYKVRLKMAVQIKILPSKDIF